ncbi:MAG: hypothetical protein LBL66_07920, partial [Clostridiales bacterium]|nr:hypothetical protein [Clostridiales bacterium]
PRRAFRAPRNDPVATLFVHSHTENFFRPKRPAAAPRVGLCAKGGGGRRFSTFYRLFYALSATTFRAIGLRLARQH